MNLMKSKQSVLITFALLILIGSVCRVAGFAPQIAMAIFGGAVISDKRLGFILPLLSMFISDLIFQVLFVYGLADYGGIYEGQLLNYIVLGSITLLGFFARNLSIVRIAAVTLAGPTLFFLLSNFFVWLGYGGLVRPHTFEGLMQCYADAAPFFRATLVNTIVFSVLFFGGFFLVRSKRTSEVDDLLLH
jgi:hypothetical protein